MANDARISEANQELFLLVRDDTNSDWQIGRYIFSTTTPPPTAAKTHVPVLLDAPESFGTKLRDAIAAVTDQPIKVLVYSQRHRNYHSDEGDLFIYVPESKFLVAVDSLAPGYVPFMNLDLTSNFHEYLKVFDDILGYDFDVFLGGHLTPLGHRADVELTQQYVRDVYEMTKRVHDSTDIMAVMTRTAQAEAGWDNKYLLFQAFLDQVTAEAAAEVQARWIDKLAGVDVFVDSHVRTALISVRWDD